MTYQKRQNILTLAMLIGACLTFLTAWFSAFAESSGQAQHEVLRLHILPSSNNSEDQALKAQLRDFIIAEAERYFADSKTLDEAIKSAEINLADIQKNAETFVRAQGYTYDVQASLVNMYFTTRVYENITMPAGNYNALRITIGEGAGQNWWCVVFPPLCLPAVTAGSDKEPYFSPGVGELIETGGRIEVRFKVYEWWREVFG
jgi:stage II sporulation protein R